jgi:NADH-quinone oxidoreductase subunit F
VHAAGWTDGVRVDVFEGPDEYLYGEETALLEVLDGRHPFPRIAPPFRRGADEVVIDLDELTSESSLPNRVEMAGPTHTDAPPALVDNVETLANIPGIIGRGATWFREVGTERSPGTIVCTVSGSTAPGVGEYAMGTPIREVIDDLGGEGASRRVKAVLPGVSSGVLLAHRLDTPLTYEDMAAADSGLGSAGFIVVDDSVDAVSFAAGVSRFLAVESCGQCTPCKDDGLAIAALLDRMCGPDADAHDYDELVDRIGTVADGARCSLGRQHETVIGSVVRRFDRELRARVERAADPVEPMLVAELLSIDGDVAVWDQHHREKQPDWTFDETDSGKWPANRFADHRSG